MVNKQVIETIYKQYKKRPASPDELDIGLLFMEQLDQHEIYIDGDRLIINSVEPNSPFHSLPLSKIHAILNFENVVAIVMHSSIVFLSKKDRTVSVHIKMDKPSLLERVKTSLAR